MVDQNDKSRVDRSGKEEDIKIVPEEEKIEFIIEHVIRIYAREVEACKNSFEEWADKWDK